MSSKVAELMRQAASVIGDARVNEGADALREIERELEEAAAAEEADEAAELMRAAPVTWAARVEGMKPGELCELESRVTAYAERAARVAGYLRERGATGCGDGGHARGVAASNRLAARVRKALGYTQPRADINF